MGTGSVALAALAWLLVAFAFPLSAPHEFASVGLMIALSGAAVAWEGRRVEERGWSGGGWRSAGGAGVERGRVEKGG